MTQYITFKVVENHPFQREFIRRICSMDGRILVGICDEVYIDNKRVEKGIYYDSSMETYGDARRRGAEEVSDHDKALCYQMQHFLDVHNSRCNMGCSSAEALQLYNDAMAASRSPQVVLDRGL